LSATKKAHFSRGLFGFLEELRCNNRREWFEANRARYERDVREPMFAFITDFAPRLDGLFAPTCRAHYGPRPPGGHALDGFKKVPTKLYHPFTDVDGVAREKNDRKVRSCRW
jgi:hypothetical protein